MRFLLLLLTIVSCQDYNSNSSDRGLYGPLNLDESDPNFRAAYIVIKSRCANCHEHSNWAELKSNAAWLALGGGIVIPNDTANSGIVNRLINEGSDMPQGGSALSTAEYNAIKLWVSAFAP